MVSTLFVIIRYLGLSGFMIELFMGTTFVPGPATLCEVLNVFSSLWALFVYICAADLVMILRLWAMYNRSRIVLGILLTSYLGQIVASTVSSIIYSNPKRLIAVVNKTLDLSFCSVIASANVWNEVALLCQLIHAGIMCTLVIIQFIILSVQMYRATRHWRLGPLFNLLVMEGMTYFFCHLDVESPRLYI